MKKWKELAIRKVTEMLTFIGEPDAPEAVINIYADAILQKPWVIEELNNSKAEIIAERVMARHVIEFFRGSLDLEQL